MRQRRSSVSLRKHLNGINTKKKKKSESPCIERTEIVIASKRWRKHTLALPSNPTNERKGGQDGEKNKWQQRIDIFDAHITITMTDI